MGAAIRWLRLRLGLSVYEVRHGQLCRTRRRGGVEYTSFVIGEERKG